MRLTDGRIELRPPEERDLPLVRAAAADPYIPRITSIPTPFDDDAGRAWLARQRRKHEEGEWALVIRETVSDEPLGFIGIGQLADPAVAQTGYWVLSEGGDAVSPSRRSGSFCDRPSRRTASSGCRR